MTLWQAIAQADQLRHNGHSQQTKILWLSQLDQKIHALVHKTHEGTLAPFSGYDEDTPQDRQLLATGPFEELYVYWLEARMCYADGETADYNAAMAQYNRLYGGFAAAYSRSHTPLGRGRFRF